MYNYNFNLETNIPTRAQSTTSGRQQAAGRHLQCTSRQQKRRESMMHYLQQFQCMMAPTRKTVLYGSAGFILLPHQQEEICEWS